MGGGGGGGDGEPEFQVAPLIDVLLVMLIFFMSITTSQVMKIDASIKLPLAKNGVKRDDKLAAGLINISWDEPTKKATFKIDDVLIDGDLNAPDEGPAVSRLGGKTIVAELKARQGKNKDFRLLIRADRAVQGKFLQLALKWGAQAGIANIAFSGTNIEK
ncbi:MAG: biopolymer transporter ExbD [Puniceicoccales bacterium]|jgi:biopolymer transport protein ExbD|nr:biopolymer transporter ExbD [Puniceicoccales bacterium]